MVKPGKRSRGEAETYESDGGFVSNDESAPKKKTKKETGSTGKGDDGNLFWELSSGRTPRRVEISEFKNMKLVNIREFYEKDGKVLPGKKGISLTVEQYQAFLKAIPAINATLKSQGVDVSGNNDDDDENMDEEKPKGAKKSKKEKKANIEATSDEEEDD